MNSPPRILYVDDDQDGCDMMSILLRDCFNYSVTAAIDGREARDLIRTQDFDLFLLDYCLPDITGVDLCQTIRELDADVPIVIYSALDRDIDREKAMAAGASKYLIKPDQLDSLRAEIDALLLRSTRTDTEPNAPASVGHLNARPKRKASGIV